MKPGSGNPLARHTPMVVGAARDIKEWTREILHLSDAEAIFVNELTCSAPGCPPKETVIVAMGAGQAARQGSIHKSLVDVTRRDVVEAFAIAIVR